MEKRERVGGRISIDCRALQQRLPRWEIHHVREVDSTNRFAKSLTSERAIVIANEQSGGRGRLGRSFYSPVGGLYLSIRLPVTFAVTEAQLLTSIASVATSEALYTLYEKRCQIKWINDLYYQEKKVCGILTEGVVQPSTGKLSSVVVGIGINLLTTISADLTEQAISLFDPSEIAELDATLLVATIVEELIKIVDSLPDRSYLSIYRAHSLLLGKEIVIWEEGFSRRAKAVAVDEWARLVVVEEGTGQRVLSSPQTSIRLVR